MIFRQRSALIAAVLWAILLSDPASAAPLCGTKTYLAHGSVVTLDVEAGGVISEFALKLTEDIMVAPPTATLPDDPSASLFLADLAGKVEGAMTFGRTGSMAVEYEKNSYVLEHQAGQTLKAVPNGPVIDVRFKPGAAAMASDAEGNSRMILKKGTVLEIPTDTPRRLEVRLGQAVYVYDSVDASQRAHLKITEPIRTAPQSRFKAVLRKPDTTFSTERVVACVRPVDRALGAEFVQTRDVEIVETKDGEMKLEMSLPDAIRDLDAFKLRYLGAPIDLQVVGFTAGGDRILGETRYYVGSPKWAASGAVTALLVFYLLPLWFLRRRRDKRLGSESGGTNRPGFRKPVWFSMLWLGRDRHGRSSLSNCQIALWTYLVFGVAVYVFVLNGQLIDISDSILILLGITGSASVAARVTASRQEERVETILRADAAAGPHDGLPAMAYPAWHDLISTAGQIDLARLQMFVFTVLAAAYVGVTAVVTFQFPEVPDGLLWLMGISNGVYLGGKIAEPALADRLAEIDLQRRAARRFRETREGRLKEISDRLTAKRAEEVRFQGQITSPPAGTDVEDLQAKLKDCQQAIASLEREQTAAQEALDQAKTEESRLEGAYRDAIRQLNASLESSPNP